jgi:hypothetical protein
MKPAWQDGPRGRIDLGDGRRIRPQKADRLQSSPDLIIAFNLYSLNIYSDRIFQARKLFSTFEIVGVLCRPSRIFEQQVSNPRAFREIKRAGRFFVGN